MTKDTPDSEEVETLDPYSNIPWPNVFLHGISIMF